MITGSRCPSINRQSRDRLAFGRIDLGTPKNLASLPVIGKNTVPYRIDIDMQITIAHLINRMPRIKRPWTGAAASTAILVVDIN